MIKAQNLVKTIKGKTIISNLSLEIKPGAFYALLGPNGAGKTTTIRLLTGVLTPDEGSVTLFGHDLAQGNIDPLRKEIGVQNDGNLYETLTVRENLKFWGELYELSDEKTNSRINQLLEFFDLEDKIDSPINSLSKGMRQKALLARALLSKPKLLILDEPTSGLDPQSQMSLVSYLSEISKLENITILMCTHLLDGLDEFVDHLAIINHGKILAQGQPNDLIKKTWLGERYIAETSDNNLAYEIITKFIGVEHAQKVKNGISLTCKDQSQAAEIVKLLVDANVSVYAFSRDDYKIKDLYFELIKEDL